MTLYHEVSDDSVELGAIVVTSPRQLCEIPAGTRRVSPVQLHGEFAHPEKQNSFISWLRETAWGLLCTSNAALYAYLGAARPLIAVAGTT